MSGIQAKDSASCGSALVARSSGLDIAPQGRSHIGPTPSRVPNHTHAMNHPAQEPTP